jgi:hypothetical protein
VVTGSVLVAVGCGRPEDEAATRARVEREIQGRLAAVLDRTLDAIDARVDSVDDRLEPLPLLRPSEEAALRSYLQDAHLARARALGARPESEDAIPALEREGRLVRLSDTTEYWVIRDLEHSLPYVTPDTRALLRRLGDRFHNRLDGLGIPRYRFEISSVLRTPDQQAALRSDNVNAAGGTSAHEFGTTVDVAYSGYAAPAGPLVEPGRLDATWLEGPVRRVSDAAAERVAARRSRELQAVLGTVLREMQSAGLVYVTLERLQPVYHVTVAERLEEGR